MGGRGGYSGGFYRETRKRINTLQAQAKNLDAQIQAIDDAADAAGREYAERKKESNARFGNTSQRYYDMDYENGRLDYLESSKRGELATKRMRVKAELNRLKSGQRTLL